MLEFLLPSMRSKASRKDALGYWTPYDVKEEFHFPLLFYFPPHETTEFKQKSI